MVRTKTRARSRTGGKAPRRPLVSRFARTSQCNFQDHAGSTYTVVCDGWKATPVTEKLGIQLYCLGSLTVPPGEVGEKRLWSSAFDNSHYQPRADVYTGFANNDECIEHHRREKAFRKKAAQEMRQAAVEGLSEEEALEKLLNEVRGKEPPPHIVPTWCESDKFQRWRTSNRYRSWILVISEDCHSWEDVKEKGISYVQFDLDVIPGIEIDDDDEYDDDDSCLDGEEDGWVWVRWNYLKNAEPVKSTRLCVRELPCRYNDERDYYDTKTGRFSWQTPGTKERLDSEWWWRITEILWSCTYHSETCYNCDNDVPHSKCERELNEHCFDDDAQCIACRRAREYRHRSKRIAARSEGS